MYNYLTIAKDVKNHLARLEALVDEKIIVQ